MFSVSSSRVSTSTLQKETIADNQLVVIDSAVASVPALHADVQSTAKVLLLDQERDGVAQIAKFLQQFSRVSSLHIVTHGSSGNLRLGNTHLNFETLDRHLDALKNWASRLQGVDVLLYGCEVAAGSMGQLFVQQLHQLTGANIAASTGLVGSAHEGANWHLDVQVGNVNSGIVFSQELQQRYSGHFIEVSATDNTDILIETEGTEYTVSFDLSEAPPVETGTPVILRSSIPGLLSEFNILAGGVTGFFNAPVVLSATDTLLRFDAEVDGEVPPGGPFEASLTLPVANDFVEEGPEEITLEILPVPDDVLVMGEPVPGREGVTINPDASTVSVTIFDNPSQLPSIVGTEGDDRLTGDDGENTIDALGGNDLVFAGGGNDTVSAGSGDDRVFADEGNDLIWGGLGEDKIFAQAGNDRISGGEDADSIFASTGDDVLSGDEGDDLLLGGDGNDILMGVTGNDVILGGDGSDIIVFGNGDGTDTVIGFSEEDSIGLVEGELTFDDLNISQDGFRTVLGVTGTGEVLATFLGVTADSLTADRFILVPDVSDLSALPDDAPFI